MPTDLPPADPASAEGAAPAIDTEALRPWIGRTQTEDDWLSPQPPRALDATLDHAPTPWTPGRALPPLWHWLYFLPVSRISEVGPDGHPQRGRFLPPVPLPRRMWAGSRLVFGEPLRVGQAVQRRSTIRDISVKHGRSGTLVFLKLEHALHAEGAEAPAVLEAQDIVYRAAARPGEPAPAPQPAPGDAQWQRRWLPDPVLLFRYSALTFNGHRIHYDRPYTTQEEGYPGLVVHGPLIATLMLDLVRRERPDAALASFEFRALRPSFEGRPLSVHARPEGEDGRTLRLWAQDDQGFLTLDGRATLR